MKRAGFWGVFSLTLSVGAMAALPTARTTRARANCWALTGNVAGLVEVQCTDANSNGCEPATEVESYMIDTVAKHILIGKNNKTSIAMTKSTTYDCGYKGGTTTADGRYPTGSTWDARYGLYIGSQMQAPRSNFIISGSTYGSGDRFEVVQKDDSNGNAYCKLKDGNNNDHWFYKVCLDADNDGARIE